MREVLLLLALLVTIATAHTAQLCGRFHDETEGYRLEAVRRAFWPLLLAVFVQAVLARGILHKFPGSDWHVLPIGVLMVVAPDAVLAPIVAKWPQLNVKLVNRLLNTTVSGQFIKKVGRLRQRDIYDWGEGRGFFAVDGVSHRDQGRRVRVLYERLKVDMARESRDPGLLSFDAGRDPGDRLYPLVKHLGRSNLRERLARPPVKLPPERSWDGRERRRNEGRGSAADRKTTAPGQGLRRVSDNEDFVRLIAKGDAGGDPRGPLPE